MPLLLLCLFFGLILALMYNTDLNFHQKSVDDIDFGDLEESEPAFLHDDGTKRSCFFRFCFNSPF